MAARRRPKCACGCGQSPAKRTRQRKAACPWCGEIVYQSRTGFSRGLLTCHCGGTLEPVCLYDACAAPGELGAAAYSELCAREDDSAHRSEMAKRRAISPARCASCATFRPFGANCDPSAEPDPCPKCGSTAPTVIARRRTIEAAAVAAMPF